MGNMSIYDKLTLAIARLEDGESSEVVLRRLEEVAEEISNLEGEIIDLKEENIYSLEEAIEQVAEKLY